MFIINVEITMIIISMKAVRSDHNQSAAVITAMIKITMTENTLWTLIVLMEDVEHKQLCEIEQAIVLIDPRRIACGRVHQEKEELVAAR